MQPGPTPALGGLSVELRPSLGSSPAIALGLTGLGATLPLSAPSWPGLGPVVVPGDG